MQKDKLQDLINRGLRLERPSKVRRDVPKISNISNILAMNQLDSKTSFKLDGFGSKTMQNNSPRGAFNFGADENQNLSHRIHGHRKQPTIRVKPLNTRSIDQPSPSFRRDPFQFQTTKTDADDLLATAASDPLLQASISVDTEEPSGKELTK